MPQTKNLIDDISRLATSTASAAFESGKDIGDKVKSQLHSVLKSMDIVTREEFEVVRELAEKQSLEIIELKKEIIDLKKANSPSKTKKDTKKSDGKK